MAALYKQEGVSPLGGCLPLLLQLPIFFALYNLLNRTSSCAGPPSSPAGSTTCPRPRPSPPSPPINLLFWKLEALRILPFLMLVTTFLQSKVSQRAPPRPTRTWPS